MPPEEEHHHMSREELKEAIEEEQVIQTNRILRWIIAMILGGCGSILAGGVLWGNLNNTVHTHQQIVTDLRPKVSSLENWRERMDASRVTQQEAAALDKRLQRVEDQNLQIIDSLRKIESKL